MINIFFVPGMFGTSLEYIIDNANSVLDAGLIGKDGSMHLYDKKLHLENLGDLQDFNSKIGYAQNHKEQIATILYPARDAKLSIILDNVETFSAKNLLLCANNVEDCELNILFQYYKITHGHLVKTGFKIFSDPDEKQNVKNWNSAYQSLDDLKHWEYREWFSLFYCKYSAEWIHVEQNLDDNFLMVNNRQFLENPFDKSVEILKYCNKKFNSLNLKTFCQQWKQRQMYIFNRYKVLNDILNSVLNSYEISWPRLNIIEEAIVQQRLRKHGYEMMCDGLKVFPQCTNNLIKKIYRYK